MARYGQPISTDPFLLDEAVAAAKAAEGAKVKRALSAPQTAEPLRAASVLPPAQRDQFLAAVDARLCSLPHRLKDGDVQSAIVAVLADNSITTYAFFMCDAQPKETSHDDAQLRNLRSLR